MVSDKLNEVMTVLSSAEQVLKELLATESIIEEIMDDLSPEQCKQLFTQCDVVEKLMKEF